MPYCGKEVHWRCSGVNKDNEKEEIIKSNCWSCTEYRSLAVECNLCKSKTKEIKNLKTINTELSKKLDRIKYDIKQCKERCIDLEDRLAREELREILMNYNMMAILLVILLMMNTIEEEKHDPTDPARGNQNTALEVERKMVSVREWQFSTKDNVYTRPLLHQLGQLHSNQKLSF